MLFSHSKLKSYLFFIQSFTTTNKFVYSFSFFLKIFFYWCNQIETNMKWTDENLFTLVQCHTSKLDILWMKKWREEEKKKYMKNTFVNKLLQTACSNMSMFYRFRKLIATLACDKCHANYYISCMIQCWFIFNFYFTREMWMWIWNVVNWPWLIHYKYSKFSDI